MYMYTYIYIHIHIDSKQTWVKLRLFDTGILDDILLPLPGGGIGMARGDSDLETWTWHKSPQELL